jgi:hypothetical protein
MPGALGDWGGFGFGPSACVSHIDSNMFHHQTSFWWLNQQQHDKTGKYGGNIMGISWDNDDLPSGVIRRGWKTPFP